MMMKGLGWAAAGMLRRSVCRIDGGRDWRCAARLTPLVWRCCCCSCDKKLLELGWQEKTPWEEGLKKTVDW